MKSAKKFSPKRRFILPIVLIIFILSLLGYRQFQQLDLDLNISLGEGIVSPLPEAKDQESILKEKLDEYGIMIKDFEMLEGSIAATISGATTAYFNLKDDLSEQVLSLQFILSRAKMEGKLPKIVDLRFDKPVVSY